MRRALLVLVLFLGLNPVQAEEKIKIITRTGVGQIRLERASASIIQPEPQDAKPPIVISDPVTNDPPVTVTPNSPELDQLQMIINAVPAAQFHGQDRLGIYYDAAKPISLANPVRIYNIKTGGYFSAYFDDESFLRFTVGTVPNSVNGIAPLAQADRIDINNLDFQDSAILETVYNDENLTDYKIGSTEQVSMDILPRFRKRYGTVTRTTLINGIYIPKGSIVVGSRDSAIARPGFQDMDNLRFYSPEGVLLNVVPEQDKDKLDCGTVSNAQCFDFDSYYTPQGSTEFGAKAFATYNTKDFFPGKSARAANATWLDIQKDLEANTALNINSGKEPWHERVLKELNKQEEVYLINLRENKTSLELMQELFGYSPTDAFFKFQLTEVTVSEEDRYKAYCLDSEKNGSFNLNEEDGRDEALNKSYESMFCKLRGFTDAKKEKWKARSNWLDAGSPKSGGLQEKYDNAQDIQKSKQAEYTKAREIYNYELKYGAIERKTQDSNEAQTVEEENEPEVVDPGIPASCTKKKDRDTKPCRQYYDAPPRCINNNGYLKKNDTSCHGYKSPGFAPEPETVIRAPVTQPRTANPVVAPPPPPPPPPPPKKKKKQTAQQKAQKALKKLLK